MQRRELGTSGLEVSALGLGCMGMSYHRSVLLSPDEASSLLRTAVDLGVTSAITIEGDRYPEDVAKRTGL
jgi:aryl-alcohol dehydrogenase-like predicted oxidoreductase